MVWVVDFGGGCGAGAGAGGGVVVVVVVVVVWWRSDVCLVADSARFLLSLTDNLDFSAGFLSSASYFPKQFHPSCSEIKFVKLSANIINSVTVMYSN